MAPAQEHCSYRAHSLHVHLAATRAATRSHSSPHWNTCVAAVAPACASRCAELWSAPTSAAHSGALPCLSEHGGVPTPRWAACGARVGMCGACSSVRSERRTCRARPGSAAPLLARADLNRPLLRAPLTCALPTSAVLGQIDCRCVRPSHLLPCAGHGHAWLSACPCSGAGAGVRH